MRSAAQKIMAGLKEALAVAKGEKAAARVTIFSKCDGCSGMTKTVDGRCASCGDRKV